MVGDLVASMLPEARGRVVATIGFAPGEAEAGGLVIDLDRTEPSRPLDTGPDAAEALALVARTFTDLRRGATVAGLLPAVRRVVVVVAEPSAAYPLTVPESLPGWPGATTRAGPGPDHAWSVEVVLPAPLPAGEVVSAIALGAGPRRPAPVASVALVGPGTAHWRPGDPGATRHVAGVEAPDGPGPQAPADVLLRALPDGDPVPPAAARVLERPSAERLSWAALGGHGRLPATRELVPWLRRAESVPPYDEQSVSPAGFVSQPSGGHGRLVQHGDAWRVVADDMPTVSIHASGAVTDRDVADLRHLRSVAVRWGRHSGPVAAVRAVGGLAGAGVPLLADTVPSWAAALGRELSDLLTGVTPAELDDDLRREEHSIRLRRAAYRRHSTDARWRALAAALGLRVPPPPRVSVLLSPARADRAGEALAQIARQRHVDLEVVVVLHRVAAADMAGAAADLNRPLITVEVPGDAPRGEALHRGAMAATGDYLASWHERDWYGPEHLADLVMAARYSGAELVGCVPHLVYLEQIDLTVHRPGPGSERPGGHLAGGSLLVDRRRFDDAGGFRPVDVGVESDLRRTLVAAGVTVYRTHGLGFLSRQSTVDTERHVPVTRFLRGSGRQWRGLHHPPLFERDRLDDAGCRHG